MKHVLIIAQGLLMVFAAFVIVTFLYMITSSVFTLITGISYISPDISYCLMVIAVMIAIIFFYLWYRKYAVKGGVEQVELKDIISVKTMGIYLMMGIGCQLFMSRILVYLRPLLKTLFIHYDEAISSLFVADTIIVAVYVVILAPVVEELMLRGILFNRLRYGVSFPIANIIQAAVFGLYHWNIIQGIYAFAIGLILGYIYERKRSLLAPIIVHGIINGSGFLIQWLNIGQYIPSWLAIVIGGGLLLGGIYLFKKNTDFISGV